MQGHHLKYDDTGNLVFFFLEYTNEIPLPNPGFSLYKSPSLTFTLVEQEEARRSSVSRRSTRSRARDEAGSTQQPPPNWHHLCLRRTWRDGSQLCRRLGSRLGFSLAGDTPYIHMRLEGRDGTRPEDQDGMRARLIPLTLRDYHHPSIHDSLLQTIRSWTASTPASEGWNSAHVRFKIHLTLTCRVRPSGTNSSSNSSRTSTRCWDNNKKHRRPTGSPWDIIPDHRPRASLGEDPRRGTLYLFLHF
jgi:hypothetical protein